MEILKLKKSEQTLGKKRNNRFQRDEFIISV